jgi:2-polyprenyl-3-methyl-5-hydroxy-6-metoxy-1,4-benzoquinol methylase
VKYYYKDNISRYRKFREAGRAGWSKVQGSDRFENFSSRSFLEEALPWLRFSAPRPEVLEYGCGTGPGACFLARKGFQVDGIDIIPIAIDVAKHFAEELNLDINYEVQDICELPRQGKKYDMIVDSFCLQHIISDEDREKVFSAVGARLKPGGYYLVSSAMFDKDSLSEECVLNAETGIVYNRYGDDYLINAETSIVYEKLGEGPGNYEESINIRGDWYLPYRKHLKASALKAELEAAGFRALYQGGEYGENVICAQEETNAALYR